MIKPFVIVSLPRSRTAWLATYLTHGDVTCFHDHGAENLIRDLGVNNGNADSSLCFIPDQVLQWEKEGLVKVMVVDRKLDDVYDSLLAAMWESGITHLDDAIETALKKAWLGLEKIKMETKGLVVPYEDIDERVHFIHAYLTGHIPFSDARFNMLKDFKITQKISVVYSRIIKSNS